MADWVHAQAVMFYLVAVTSDDLTDEQIERLKAIARRYSSYLNRLRDRMREQRFNESDPLLMDTVKAADAMQSLWLTLHYISCAGSVGTRKRRK